MPPRRPETVCLLGLGRVGLPTAAVLARAGCQVHGVDIRDEVVDVVRRGETQTTEPQLDALVARLVASGRLTAGRRPVAADVFVICVPTPLSSDRSADLSHVEEAARAIAPHVRRGGLVVIESTCPPGTTEQVVARLATPETWQVGRDLFVAHCPERVLPGRILFEAVHNDRLVGGVTPACTERARQFYQTIVTGEVVGATAAAAEMAKLAENAFRDLNIAFANELSMLAAEHSLDPLEVISLANRHPRVEILTPGPGVGGHCIGVDPWFLHQAAPDSAPLIRVAREVNDSKPAFLAQQIAERCAGRPAAVIGCLGLTYKADVDDLRNSPSLEVIRQLERQDIGRRRLVCDPLVSPKQFDEFRLTALSDVLHEADVLVLLTDHQEFRDLPDEALQGKLLIDPRGAWRGKRMLNGRRSAG